MAYVMTDIPGYCKAIWWEGSGNVRGPLVELDFEPQILLFKRATASGNNWRLWDVADDRWKYNGIAIQRLLADATSGEASDGVDGYLMSNGFKIRTVDGYVNTNSSRYVGFAWGHRPRWWSPARFSDEADRI
jgi:hypothetical protein